MASSSKRELSVDQVIQLVYDYDNQMRQAVEVGMDSVRETMQRIVQGLKNILPIIPTVRAAFPNRVFLFTLITAWNIDRYRNNPAFIEQLRAEVTKIPSLPQRTRASSTVTAPVHDPLVPPARVDRVSDHTSSAIPAAAPTVHPVQVATPSAAEPSIPLAAPTVRRTRVTSPSAKPSIPHAAPTIPAVTTLSATDLSTSTTAIEKAVPFNPSGFKVGPPKAVLVARDDILIKLAALSKPATSEPATSMPAVSKSAVAEPKTKSRPKPNARNTKVEVKSFQMIEDEAEDSEVNCERRSEPDDYIDEDEEHPDEDDDQPDEASEQPAEGSSGYKHRRRAREPVMLAAFHNPACDRCVRRKRSCHKEAKGGACYLCVLLKSKCSYAKSKATPKTQRKSKESIDDEIDTPRIKGSKSKVKWIDISNDEDSDEKSKQPARHMKTATAPVTGQLMSPEIEGVLNGVQLQLRQLTEEMKELKGLLREVLCRPSEEDHSVVYVRDDDMKTDASGATGYKVARLFARSSKAAAAAEPPYAAAFTGIHTPAVPLATSSEAAPVVAVDFLPSITESTEVTPAMASPSFAENDESSSYVDLQLVDLHDLARHSPAPYYTDSPLLSHLPENLILDDTPPSTPLPFLLSNIPGPDSTSNPKFTFQPPSKIPTLPTSPTGTNADRLPTVNLQSPTPQTEVTNAGPQTTFIRLRPLWKRVPEESSAAAHNAKDYANPVAAAALSDSLKPPSEGRMTLSRGRSSGPPSPAGKRKADVTEIGRTSKRRK